jgi:cytochrome c-type biogenesis protein CcmH/NrfF
VTLGRREFLGLSAVAMMPAVAARRQQPAKAGQGVAGDTLVAPLGQTVAAVGPLDNDAAVIAIERRLRCTCGCTLDVYTCRTTDFSCTYSPAMHRHVVAARQRGDSADRILAAFVAEDGESVLMAAPAQGFNLLGYVLPGVTVAGVGCVLTAWLLRTRAPGPVPVRDAAPVVPPNAADLDRLQRALDDVEA